MRGNGRGKRQRDESPDLPKWWIDKARDLVKATKGQEQLMEALSARAGRTWDRSVLSNFKRGAFLPGPKLAIAISDHFQIERPFFVARTESEAATIRMLQQIAAPSDHEAPPPVRSGAEPQRLQHLDEDLHQLESEARQITSVPSKDESRAKSRKRT